MRMLIQFRNGDSVKFETTKSYEKLSFKQNFETGMIELRCDDPPFLANSQDVLFVKQLPDAEN